MKDNRLDSKTSGRPHATRKTGIVGWMNFPARRLVAKSLLLPASSTRKIAGRDQSTAARRSFSSDLVDPFSSVSLCD
jgi:hypothetical protein